MSEHSNLTSLFSDIADSIRAKTGENKIIIADDFPSEIDAIQSGGGATEPYIEEAYNSSGQLTSAVLHGHTMIRGYMFYACTNLALVSLPSGITSIGAMAFQACANLELTSLPSGITSIGDYAFYGCKKLALTSLPNSIKSIGTNAFNDCKQLALTSLPSRVTSIGATAFQYCTSLTTMTFGRKPNTLSSNAFNGCTNLLDIYVPWAEGEMSGAPWGAKNATIHYNS